MRACQWLVPLLLAVTAPVPRAGAAPASDAVGKIVEAAPEVCGRTPPVPRAGAAAALDAVGTIANVAPEVCGGTPGSVLPQLAAPADVLPGMAVQTRPGARATIEILGPPAPSGKPALRDKSAFRGVVAMGEKSKVIFDRWVRLQFQPALPLQALLGQFLVFILPRPKGDVTGQVEIEIPDHSKVTTHGTAVYLRVWPDGTARVVVLEGKVTIEGAAGGQVSVPQGSEVTLEPGRPPPRPTPVGPPLPVVSGPVWPVEAPLRLDYPRLEQALELPKTRHP
jgi:hypothetical protein